MKTISDIITFIGRDRAAVELRVSDAMLRAAMRDNRAPASWYHALERLAGRPLDRALFSFKGGAAQQEETRP